MALRNEAPLPASLKLRPPPVEFITENGFSIVRLCDLDQSVLDTAACCRFVVQNPNGSRLQVTVEFNAELVRKIQQERRNPLASASSFWLECAERQLATHIWHNDSWPHDGRLKLHELSADDLLLARYWRD